MCMHINLWYIELTLGGVWLAQMGYQNPTSSLEKSNT